MYKQTVVQKIYSGILLVALLSCFLAGCGKGDSPEDQIREFIAAGELAAESKDIGGIKDLISEQYTDEHKRTRRDLVAVTMRYFYANRNIHILTRIKELHFLSEKKAVLHLYVAMTGQDVSDKDSFVNIQAELYRFDLELVRKGKEWKLVRADWRSAMREDFF